MSDEGEKACPLCAEEMDLTDQQLKPCKCGYEICVWCWHHIMDMAEKDDAQGRCPACRTPYNKERIVGTAAKFEKLVTELNVDKKHKLLKGKSKTSEGRKQLESVRVLQRNLVYVVGLPLNYADEDILRRKDYFSQYGKVLKVSISRTSTGAIQQLANNTCSVYITYSKEEEAVRCIQSVHGFVLDGKSLRACFGTTKYCHAWLRNVPCSNKDCLYLHEIGSQEDSFTKDEIISAYTRNRVQQTTGLANSTLRRAGNVLPPPGDEYCNNNSTSGKPITKAAINTNPTVASSARASPPNSSSGGIAALPAGASWGTRPANNSQPSPTSTPYFNAPPNQKSDISNGPAAISKKSSSAGQVSSLQSDSGKKKVQNQENILSREKMKKETSGSIEKESNADSRVPISDGSVAFVHLVNLPPSRQPCSPPKTNLPPDSSKIVDSSVFSTGTMPEKKSIDHTDGTIENVCSSILSMSIHGSQQVQNDYLEYNREALIHQVSAKPDNTIDDRCSANGQSDLGPGIKSKVTQVDWKEREDDLLSFDNQRINDPEVAIGRVQEFPDVLNISKHSDSHSHEFNNTVESVGIGFDRQVIDRNGNLVVPTLNFPNSRSENLLHSFEGNDNGNFDLFPIKERSLPGRCEDEPSSYGVDMGERRIISNILSMDFDPWNESLASPQNLVKLLGETDKRDGPFGVSGSWKIHSSNQSRFSFAREAETMNHVPGSGQSIDYLEQACRLHPFGHDSYSSHNLYFGRSVSRNGLPVLGGTEPDSFAGSSNSHISSNKLSASRSQFSAPPGFSVPSRAAPPPGFASHDRTDTEPIFESLSGNHRHDSSLSLLRNQCQIPSNSNTFSSGDLEFMDPAILAVGKGTLPGCNNNPGLDMRSIFPLQLNTNENTRFQSLLQSSLLPHQNQRFNNDLQDGFSTLVDAYGLPFRIVDQTSSNTQPPFSQLNLPNSRNGVNTNGRNPVMAEVLRSELLGYNNFYGGYEDSKIQSPSSGNLYNKTYGI